MLDICSSRDLVSKNMTEAINVRGNDGGRGRGWKTEGGEGRKNK